MAERQAAAGDPDIPLDEARERARVTISEIDRRWFLTQVALGTVRELVALRHWRDAVVVAMRFGQEVGPRVAASLLAEIGRARIRKRDVA